MPQVTGRYIDKSAWHVVITRSGDVIRHERFDTLTAADDFVTALGLETPDQLHERRQVKVKGGLLSTFNRPLKEWT